MPEFDWRSPETYKPIQDVNAAGFAWEFLRRNPDYRRDVRKRPLSHIPTSKAADAFARHWGLPFRNGPQPLRGRDTGVLAADDHAVRASRHACARTILGCARA